MEARPRVWIGYMPPKQADREGMGSNARDPFWALVDDPEPVLPVPAMVGSHVEIVLVPSLSDATDTSKRRPSS